MTGYQQAILMLLGCQLGGKFAVRCIDRWYADAVAELFPTAVYLQRRPSPKKDYYVVKSARVRYPVALSDVTDWEGFCRAVIELQAVVDLWPHRGKRGASIKTPRLRIYGDADLLLAIMPHLPAAPKKVQHVRTQTGQTCAIYYQSPAEVCEIIGFVSEAHGNQEKLEYWSRIMAMREKI